MSRQEKCPECGSSDIVEDTHYSQNHLVCSECGFLLTEGLLTTTLSEEAYSHEVKYTQSTEQSEHQSKCKIRGFKRVRDLCRILRLLPVIEETALSHFERAYDHPSYHTLRLEKKEILVGCSVYISCRQNNWPLTMGTICTLLHADKSLFAGIYLSLLKELKLDIPAVDLNSLVKTHCDSFSMLQSSTSVPPKLAEDKQKVVERTVQIVELASETWLVTGRHPIPLITAAAYLAWQSLRPADRLKCSLPRFCKLAGMDLPPPTCLRVREIREILLKLASRLPWLSVHQIDRNTVVKYIGDILHHQTFLLKVSLASPVCAASVDQNDKGHRELDCKRKINDFSPPSFTNPSKKIKMAPSNPNNIEQVVTGDEEISDSEIEQYLRTPEEIKAFQEIHRL